MGIISKVKALSFNDLNIDPSGTKLGSTNDWQAIVNQVATWVFMIAGVLAFFYLVYAGFIYLTAAGNPDAAKKGQQGIINAIIGLVIIFMAYGIVRIVISFLKTT